MSAGKRLTKKRQKLYENCEKALQTAKQECLDLLAQATKGMSAELSGDDGDMSNAIAERDLAFAQRGVVEKKLKEISLALDRLEDGSYGVCEETGEDIEEGRLKAIPWTTLSVEGAELRELNERRFAAKGISGDSEFDF